MANEHMRTAASNLVRAVNDLQLYKNELHTNLQNLRRDTTARVSEIDAEMKQLMTLMTQEDSEQRKAQHSDRMRELKTERDHITRDLTDQENMVQKQVQMADQNAFDLNEFAKRLQMIA